MFNACLRLQYYPTLWKIAEITAIPKVGKDAALPSSYRPISLLPLLSKIFEKVLYERLTPILEDKHTIPDHQFGFRRLHSTIHQIHRVTSNIESALEEKKFCVGLFLDVEKAFDKVWHDGLLLKLSSILPSNLYNLFKNYITGRFFYVKYKNSTSSLRPIKAGIPQGSVLGPLLYNIFTGDIPIPDDSSALIATFADDTVLMYSHNSLNIATSKLQVILDKTTTWFAKWQLKINQTKTTQVIFTNKTNYTPQHLTINNTKISIDTSAKYLGMHIDNKLTWKRHIMKKKEQLRIRLNQLQWLVNKHSKLTIENKILIYKTILKPIWTYGIQIWGTAKKSNINIIQTQQSKILRLILNADWYIRNEDIHRDIRMPTVNEEIANFSRKYQGKLSLHVNSEINNLPIKELTLTRRLKRSRPIDLIN